MFKRKASIFALAILAASSMNFTPVNGEPANMVKNPGFEDVSNNKPSGWTIQDLANGAKVEVVSTAPHSGSKCLAIKNPNPADTMVFQDIKVEKGKIYKMSFWVKSENIKNQPGSANMTVYYVSNGHGCKGIYTSEELQNTDGKWKQVTFQIGTRTNLDDPLSVGVRLGGQGTVNSGTAYFDDISVELVSKQDESIPYFKIDDNAGNDSGNNQEAANSSANASQANTDEKAPSSKTIFYVIGAVIVLALIIFIETKVSKNKKNTSNEEVVNNKSDDYDDDEDDTI